MLKRELEVLYNEKCDECDVLRQDLEYLDEQYHQLDAEFGKFVTEHGGNEHNVPAAFQLFRQELIDWGFDKDPDLLNFLDNFIKFKIK